MITRNGNPDDRPARRLRLDQVGAVRPEEAPPPPQHSGRRLVLGIVLVTLALWAGLYLVFRDWRARYRARTDFGARQVATAIDPMADVVPPDVDPPAWRQAVADTHRMLVTLTASNLLDLTQMRTLRGELTSRVARARPETARAELAQLWLELKDRSGPILNESRHPLPSILKSEPALPAREPGVQRDARGGASSR